MNTYRVLQPGKQQGALNTWSVMAGGNRIASCQREDSATKIVLALNTNADLVSAIRQWIMLEDTYGEHARVPDRAREALKNFVALTNGG